MPTHTLVNATNLDAWVARFDARNRLPQLIRRLALATDSEITQINFAAEEGVQLGGWDGLIVTDRGNAFVPKGQSGWELGVDRSIKGKADGDYIKRTKDPLGLKPTETTFVFVTLRRWGGKDAWVTEKKQEGTWGDVRAYDADDLATWLEIAPAVHVWLSHLIGTHPSGVRDLEGWWGDWAEVTAPPLTPDLLLAGRDEIVAKLHAWLGADDASAQTLRGESREEALVVFAAAVEALPPEEQEAVLARTTVVEDASAWRQLVTSDSSLLLVPMFDDRGAVTRAVQHGHHVLIPLGLSDSSSEATLQIPRLSREKAKEALTRMGLPEKRAGALAGVARRSMTSLRRALSPNPEVQQPEWAKPAEAGSLLPALLVGTWDDSNDADRDVVARLARVPYEQVTRALQRWANESDPPIRRIGDTWLLVSREDSWSLLARYLTSDDRTTFEAVVLDVLGTPDPRFDLPEEEQYLAAIHGKKLPHSGRLRAGLAETLGVMGTRSEHPVPGGGDAPVPDSFAPKIVRELLERANADWRLWASLSGLLPLLAEAAPQAFLDAVDRGSAGEDPVLRKLFFEQKDPLFSSSPHTGLLWALEVLAWSPQHLGRTARLLSRLARLDPGGRTANRPKSSLREIFLPWHPGTAASAEQRLDVLDALREREPDVAWELLCSLLPERPGGVSFPTAMPRWRDWVPDPRPSTTWAEIWKLYEEVVERLLKDVGMDGPRWRALIEQMDRLPPAQITRIADQLSKIDVAPLQNEDREQIWNQLRKLINRHREFPEADWSLPTEQLEQLERVHFRFAPDDPVLKRRWLFANGPIWLAGRRKDWREGQRLLVEARRDAAGEFVEHGGVSYVLEAATRVEDPYQLGYAVGGSDLLEEDEAELLKRGLSAPERPQQLLTRGFVVGRSRTRGIEWADRVRADSAPDWTPEQKADFLVGLPFKSETWDRVEAAGEEVDRLYWAEIFDARLEDETDCLRAVRELLDHGRPHLAVDVLGHYQDEEGAAITPALVADALSQAVRTPFDHVVHPTMYAYHVGKLLDFLEASDVEEDRIALIEWGHLPLLSHERPPRTLHRQLARSPEFFAEVLSWIYKREDEERQETTEADATRGQLAYELLESWKALPGLGDNGSINSDALTEWVRKAHELAARDGRGTVGDHTIGKILSGSPPDPDGEWPHRAVRDLLEELENPEIETGLYLGIHNSRGVTTRSLTEGGAQEWALAKNYRESADVLADRWPRTATVLRDVAAGYEAEARREDREAELREDTGR